MSEWRHYNIPLPYAKLRSDEGCEVELPPRHDILSVKPGLNGSYFLQVLADYLSAPKEDDPQTVSQNERYQFKIFTSEDIIPDEIVSMWNLLGSFDPYNTFHKPPEERKHLELVFGCINPNSLIRFVEK